MKQKCTLKYKEYKDFITLPYLFQKHVFPTKLDNYNLIFVPYVSIFSFFALQLTIVVMINCLFTRQKTLTCMLKRTLSARRHMWLKMIHGRFNIPNGFSEAINRRTNSTMVFGFYLLTILFSNKSNSSKSTHLLF